MKIRTSNKAGFTLVEIMIVVAIIGLLAAIAIPNFVKARSTSQMNGCINNLRQIDGAKQQYLLELGDKAAAPSDTTLIPYLGRGTGQFPKCPADATLTYAVGAATEVPTCAYVSADYKHELPQ